MQCSNNLKNMSLAALNHESTTKKLPSGGWSWNWWGDPDAGFGAAQPGAWTFSILPFVEQNALFAMGSDNDVESVSSPQKSGAGQCAQTPLAIFHCPSRRAAKTYPLSTTVYNADKPDNGAKGDYAANCGSANSATESSNGFSDWGTGRGKIKGKNWTKSSHNGVIFDLSEITIGEIRDGTSNTYLLGEKYLEPTIYESTSSSDDNGLYAGMDSDNERSCGTVSSSRSVTNIYLPMQDRLGFETVSYRFGSAHSGSFGVALCDGSAQRVSYAIDGEIHAYLGMRNDAQPAKLPD